MPAKKIIKKSSARRPRVASPAHKTESKTSKSARSLSEVRLRSSTVKTKASVSRTSVASQSDRHASLSASVYDLKGKAVGRVSLPAEIFGVAENPKLISQAVRVYLANQRLGTASTKTRGEVQGSTRKIYRQKGTGRARHGGIRAPIFVHGGVALGPHPHDFSLTLPQKAKRLALFCALSGKLRDGEIKIVSSLEKVQPKTKVMAKILKALDVDGKTLLVTPAGSKDLESVYRSARNIEGMRILTATTLNTYEVLDSNKIVLMKDSIEQLKKHFFKD